ncbi:MAG TPA: glycoside hydrolase family 3 N-terminal domain-containing protein, partial [Ktedonobacteraceae bacterium]|nr:glycoside hydrolase family 3 N-terminal domain-containing protein [Ktedonobacteraceae bacterium]
DINNNPDNPVIGIRSFGEDPRLVADFVAAAVRGYQQAGIVTSLKHFPGHGDTATDSHLALPTLPHTRERLEHVELLPFVKGITAGADSIMVAHLYLPALTRQDTRPASVAPAMVQGLLREQLAFDGVVITDCLEMRAIRNTVGTEQGAVMALQAGCDMVLISHHLPQQQASIAAIKAAAHDGRLNHERIQQAAERVMRLKARMLSWNEALASVPVPGTPLIDVSQLQQQAYERSITLVRNTAGLIPLSLSPEQRLLIITAQAHVSPAVDGNVASSAAFFVDEIRRRHPATDHIYLSHSSTYANILQKAQTASLILVITANATRDVHQQELVQRIIQADRPVIGLAVYNPYDISAFPQLETYLATYEYTRPALAAATRVIFGEIPAQGHLPISLPGWQR